jgi:hypothetical protein
MPTMIPMHSIKIHRKGEDAYYPPIGRPFDFTPNEVKAIRDHNFSSLRAINHNTARSDYELGEGMEQPDADETRDANVLRRAPPNSEDPGARNQGGSLEEGQVARGKMGLTPATAKGTKAPGEGKGANTAAELDTEGL